VTRRRSPPLGRRNTPRPAAHDPMHGCAHRYSPSPTPPHSPLVNPCALHRRADGSFGASRGHSTSGERAATLNRARGGRKASPCKPIGEQRDGRCG
jgi:hypothetical protein